MRSTSVILNADRPAEEHRAAIEELLPSWADALGLTFVGEGRLTDEDDIKIDTWTELDDPMIQIDLVQDKQAGASYLSAIADDEAVRDTLRRQFERDLDAYSIRELRDAVRSSGDRDPAAYLRLALGSSAGFDDETYEIVRAGLKSEGAEVRAQAAMAAALLHWPPFAADARERLTTETDESVRRLLAAVAQFAEGA